MSDEHVRKELEDKTGKALGYVKKAIGIVMVSSGDNGGRQIFY